MIDQCRRQAVLAHEICHFFQFQIAESKSPETIPEALAQLKRELAAQRIEQKYLLYHCSVDWKPSQKN